MSLVSAPLFTSSLPTTNSISIAAPPPQPLNVPILSNHLRGNICSHFRISVALPPTFHLFPNTNHITCRHLELAYQFVLSSRHSPGINLHLIFFPTLASSSPPSPLPVLQPAGCTFQKHPRDVIFTAYSHTFTHFWSRKASVIAEIFQFSVLVFMCTFIRRPLNFIYEHAKKSIFLPLQDYPKHRHPGWNKGSIGYHADDGKIFIGSGVGDPFGPRCHKGDRMGCGILFPRDYVCQYDR